jgi:indoleacetamide hydrolase
LAIKDSYLTPGLRTTFGLGTLGHFVPDEDADVVSSIKDGLLQLKKELSGGWI